MRILRAVQQRVGAAGFEPVTVSRACPGPREHACEETREWYILDLMADSRMKLRAQAGPALYSVMEPGDEIVAGAPARKGRMADPELWTLLGLVMIISGSGLLNGLDHAWAMRLREAADLASMAVNVTFIVVSLLAIARTRAFAAVTRRQFICLRMSMSGAPAGILFAVPLPAGAIASGRGSLRYTGPDGKTIRLSAPLAWRSDMHEVAAALQQAAGKN